MQKASRLLNSTEKSVLKKPNTQKALYKVHSNVTLELDIQGSL